MLASFVCFVLDICVYVCVCVCVCVCVYVLFKPGFVLDICVCVCGGKTDKSALGGSGCQSASQSERRQQPTKSQNMSFRHLYILYPLNWLKKRFETLLFLSGFQKVFLRSSLVEWVVLATCQPIVCYCLWDIFGFQVNIENISIFMIFFWSARFWETW